MNTRLAAIAAVVILLGSAAWAGHPSRADKILAELLAGNRRFAASSLTHPHESSVTRQDLAKAQHPKAVLVCCSDSRVPPELVFDQGLGDLFVVRVAGNVVDDVVLGSIEYAVEHLHVQLVVVMGHQKCGAVTAALGHESGHGHIPVLLRELDPAVRNIKNPFHDATPAEIDRAIRANVRLGVLHLKSSAPILSEHVAHGTLRVVGVVYDLKSGLVARVQDK